MKAAFAGCWVMLLVGILIAQESPGALPTITRPASPTTQPRQVPARVGGATTRPTLVSNVFVDTDLRQALGDVATQVGATIVMDPTVGGQVSCELKDVPLDKALEILLAGTSFAVKKTPDYYLVYSPDSKSPAFRQVSETEVVKLDYLDADVVAKLIPPSLKDYIQAGPKGSNMVCVTAPRPLLERIVADLKKMDQPPQHVMLDARVVVLEQNDLLNLGVQWTPPQISAGLFTNSDLNSGRNWPWGIQIGYTLDKQFTNSLLLTLNLLESNDDATVVASPRVMAQDAREAEIKVTTDQYFQIVTPGAIYVQSQLEKISSGTILKITPRLSADSQITLEMEVEVSDVVAVGQNNLPVINRRQAKTVVRLEDGGTAAVAGLMVSRTDANQVRVPGVGKVPAIGRLFRNDADTKTVKQLAVFVTARIVKPNTPRGDDSAPRQSIIRKVGPEFRTALEESIRRFDAERKPE